MKIKIGLAGAAGRMGRAIVKAISEQEDMQLVLALDVNSVGSDAGEVAGIGRISVSINPPDKLGLLLERTGAEVFVDFTSPKAAVKNAVTAADKGVKLVIGTTGLKKEDLRDIESAVKKNKVSAVISPNMATGVNLFFKLVRDAAKGLGSEYDVEIIEVHHRHKKDAPSGTALHAGALIAREIGSDLDKVGVFGRKGLVGERHADEIGVHAVRAGDVVGDHTVLFAGQGERIEITHRAHSRDAFVNGVIKAIRFIAVKKGDGKVYSTWDVLGIR